MPTLTIISKRPTFQGFRYFWLKRVTGFNPRMHCARCLNGSYFQDVGVTMPVNERVELAARRGEVLYLCGVSAPYRWANNLHAAVRVAPGRNVTVRTHTGDTVTLSDCELIPFDDAEARRRFPQLGAEFLTCRNFQFGAHHFRE